MDWFNVNLFFGNKLIHSFHTFEKIGILMQVETNSFTGGQINPWFSKFWQGPAVWRELSTAIIPSSDVRAPLIQMNKLITNLFEIVVLNFCENVFSKYSLKAANVGLFNRNIEFELESTWFAIWYLCNFVFSGSLSCRYVILEQNLSVSCLPRAFSNEKPIFNDNSLICYNRELSMA